MYLAHRTEDGREQPLIAHLTATAQNSASFAAPFGAQQLAYQIGLAHDLGKYSDAFQKRIRGYSLQTDHSTAGAQEIYKVCGIGVAYCVAGHHGGLPDGGARTDAADGPTLSARLKRAVAPYQAFSTAVSLSRPSFQPPRVIGQGGFTAAFWTRMLFSCLVDADFLDTEAFMRQDKPPRGQSTEMRTLLDRLESYIQHWMKPQTPLNQARCDILRACLDAGSTQFPGLFTLTVPTGGGKTVASLAFALRHALTHGKRRILYIIPFTSIIEQTADKFRDILGSENVLEHHINVDFDNENDPDLFRKKLATENWEMPVIVTTAVQFFESLFSNKPSRCRKLHNLANSVVIFDEAQTIPLPYLQPCVQAIAELSVNYGASCVLCTATQPALGPLFHAVAPDLSLREIAPRIDYEIFRRVQFIHLERLSDDALAARLNGHEQALCVVGTRKQAQAVFTLLDGNENFHLSTLMTPAHRRAVLAEVRKRLKNGRSCRVVSTSLIEAGVDVDFPVVYRAEAGLDSEIQAAGRCNREGKRTVEESTVYIFQPDQTYTAQLPHTLRRPLNVAKQITHDGSALDAPETIERYFTALYQYSGDALDSNRIVSRMEAGARTGSFPFASVASAFRLIDDNTRAVLIPRMESAKALAARLQAGERTRSLLRQAGQESVNIYENHFEALLARGALDVQDESVAILTDLTLYNEQTGLVLLTDGGVGIFL
ncbi:CRISPR-associated helicase Cas3' [Butyricicoccus faecihominis]|uniref:CRISPR-associated helicase Cas3' n=1 Tax=Butyricicoccus faecihominis TaxID=1712515 RepID=UPI0024792C90|nr:CRISPR-associated helicase Cas3' [Butyricicoccus faecihominis]MCQ5128660.1 CRISPR-associated helicase Cas3' [Butyricicoccus faecihominis]